MQKQNLPKTILTITFLIALALIAGLFIYGHLEIKKIKNLPVDFIEPVKPVENNNKPDPVDPVDSVEPTEPVELETYEGELFIEAKWGEGEGEVGIHRSAGDEGGAGPIYGPESFDVDDRTGHLYLLDSVNQRIIEYNENGKYLRDFPIACGGTGDVRVSPDYKYLYVWSNRCGRIYKYNIGGEFLESYSIPKEVGACWQGLDFDKDGNIMCGTGGKEKRIKYNLFEAGRKYIFYQIGKEGDEWKDNNYVGYSSNNGTEYYLMGGKVEKTEVTERDILILNKDDLFQRAFDLKLSRDGFPYFVGLDKKNNIYLEIQYADGSSDNEIRKYNQKGGLLAVIDIKEVPKINNFISNYTLMFKKQEVSQNEDIYLMYSDIEEIKIYKYSKIN